MELNDKNLTLLHGINIVIAAIGTLLCLLYLITILVRPLEYKIKMRKFIGLSFLVSCTLLNISFFFLSFDDQRFNSSHNLCFTQAILTTTGGMSSICLAFSTAMGVLLSYFQGNFVKNHQFCFTYGLTAAVWAITGIYEIVFIIDGNVKTNDAGYCVPENEKLKLFYAYFILTVLLLSTVLLLIVLIQINVYLRQVKKKIGLIAYEETNAKVSEYLPMFYKFFGVHFYISFFFVFDVLIKTNVHFEEGGLAMNFWTFIVQMGYAEVGGIIIVVYGYTPALVKELKYWLCCGKKDEIYINPAEFPSSLPHGDDEDDNDDSFL